MKSISLSYASSLFDLCVEENIADIVLGQLNVINDLLVENKDYVKLLDSPNIPLSERMSLIDEAFSFHEYVMNFLKILCEKKCVYVFFDCLKEYQKLYNKENNIENVTVITAAPLSEALTKKLIDKLSFEYKKTIMLTAKVDKSVLGGIIIRTENSQTDASVRSRLDAIKDEIASK